MKKTIMRILLIALPALGLIAWTACDSLKSERSSDRPSESITVGTSAIGLSSLIWIAKGKGYFADQDLNINLKLYESGHVALKDLLAGNLDLATATEFAAVGRFLDRPDLRIISILDQAQDQHLIARKDHGIAQASDLAHKRVGLAKTSSSEYCFHFMMISEKIPLQDVHIVDLLPLEQVKAISKGDVDAIMVWEPFATMAKKELGANGLSWGARSGHEDYWLLLSTVEAIGKRSTAMRRFLAALVSAEELIKDNEAEARRVMAQELKDRYIDSLWKNHRFRLGLDHPLIMIMEAEMRWMNPRLGTRRSDVPDLLNFVYFDALNSVKPDRIKVVH